MRCSIFSIINIFQYRKYNLNPNRMTKESYIDKKRRKLGSEESKGFQCGYFLAKKGRTCSMQRKAENKYCSQHMIYDDSVKDRVPCPLDPNHTVWEHELHSHLKKCNAKPKVKEDPWFQRDINCELKCHSKNNDTLDCQHNCNSVDEEEYLNEEESFMKYLRILQKVKYEPLTLRKMDHKGLIKLDSPTVHHRHTQQQSSLIANLQSKGLLQSNYAYIEFGCGKGELSRSVNSCIMEDVRDGKLQNRSKGYGFGLIDRGVNRLKADNRILRDFREADLNMNVPDIKRTRIDIKDLKLDTFVDLFESDKFVGISKHLCGAATDLTIKSLLNTSLAEKKATKFGGLLIAMCCRHACSYDQLLPQSKDYLKKMGFSTAESFNVLKKIVSWAVSDIERTDTEKTISHFSGLDGSERKALGLLARRVVDESRLHAIKQLMPKFNSEIFLYTDSTTTLENVCLSITP